MSATSGFDFVAGVLNPKSYLDAANRLGATARNGLEILRLGGLETASTASPYAVVERSPMYRLRRYFVDDLPASDAPVILLVPPLMVDANIFDVGGPESATGILHRYGVDVWVIDFGAPDREEGGLERNFADHVVALSRAVDHLRDRVGRDVHLAGYSQGGMFAYQVGAYRKSRGIASISTFGSPVDILGGAPLGAPPALVSRGSALLADHVFNRVFVPAWLVRRGFEALAPGKTIRNRVTFVRSLHNRAELLPREDQRRFLESEGWLAFPGPALAELLKQFFVHNRMMTGGFSINGELLTLAKLTCPIFAYVGDADQIGRPTAVRGIRAAAPKATTYQIDVDAGHFGLVVGSHAREHTWPTVAKTITAVERNRDPAKFAARMVPVTDEERNAGANPVVVAVGAMTALGLVAVRETLDAVGDANAATQAVVREAARGVPRLLRQGRLRAHTQVSPGKMFTDRARADPDGELFLYEDRVHGNGAVDARIDRVVRGLIGVGIRQGERVGVLMHTRPSALVTIAALSRLGAVSVLLPDGVSIPAATRISEMTSIVVDNEHLEQAREAEVRIFIVGGGDRRRGSSTQSLDAEVVDLEAIHEDTVRVPAWYRPNPGLGRDLAFVLVSESAGTLRAKNITNGRWALSAYGAASSAGLSERDTVFCLTPLHHSSGVMTSLGGALAGSSRVALARDIEPDRFVEDVQAYGITVVCYTWNLLRPILEAAPATLPEVFPVRAFIGSGMSAELTRRVAEKFAPARVIEFFASTEGTVVLANGRADKPGAKGQRLSGTAPVAVVAFDPETRRYIEDDRGYLQRAAAGDVGVLFGRADPDIDTLENLMRGVFEPGDAWFATPHLFRVDDDGDYWLVDDVRSVTNTPRGPVYAVPIADVLEQLDQVEQAVVYGVPSKGNETADTVVAALVLRSTADGSEAMVTAQELDEAMRLRGDQVPDVIHVVRDFEDISWHRPQVAPLVAAGLPAPGTTVWQLRPATGTYHNTPAAARNGVAPEKADAPVPAGTD